MKIKNIDVAVIGGGPAGLSACLELDKTCDGSVTLFESEAALGGIPRSSGIFFGMRDLKRVYTGKTYAEKLEKKVIKTKTDILLDTTVLEIIPGKSEDSHRIVVTSSSGIVTYDCGAIIVATGCYETSRQARLIPGSRPAGVFTTGTLQKMVRSRHYTPGSTAVIVGSEPISFSAAMTLKKAGIKILGMVEEQPTVHSSMKPLASIMKKWYQFPLYTGTTVSSIYGDSRVQGILLENDGKTIDIPCDTVIVTGRFQPEASLLIDAGITRDPHTKGPVIDKDRMTSVSGIYAAGNVIRGALMHDICALEGKQTAKVIANFHSEGR